MAGKKDKVKDSERTTILVPNLRHCFVCGTTNNIHLHEVFYGSNRAKSKEDGMVVPLCAAHHNMSGTGVHYNPQLDDFLKKQAEKIWIEHYCDNTLSKEEKIKMFINRYGRNYLDEEEL